MAKWTSLFYSGLSEKEDGVMLISIAMMFLVGMSMGWICKKIHLPLQVLKSNPDVCKAFNEVSRY